MQHSVSSFNYTNSVFGQETQSLSMFPVNLNGTRRQTNPPSFVAWRKVSILSCCIVLNKTGRLHSCELY